MLAKQVVFTLRTEWKEYKSQITDTMYNIFFIKWVEFEGFLLAVTPVRVSIFFVVFNHGYKILNGKIILYILILL